MKQDNLGPKSSKQIYSEAWMDLYGIDHPKKHAELWASFMECIIFHLQTMFRHDVAEMQRFYISNGGIHQVLCAADPVP